MSNPTMARAYGDLLVKGPLGHGQRIFQRQEGANLLVKDAQDRGWFPTGDVATVDPDGFLQITDRSKDVIKSGGEWISSIDVENIAMAHPAMSRWPHASAWHTPSGTSDLSWWW